MAHWNSKQKLLLLKLPQFKFLNNLQKKKGETVGGKSFY